MEQGNERVIEVVSTTRAQQQLAEEAERRSRVVVIQRRGTGRTTLPISKHRCTIFWNRTKRHLRFVARPSIPGTRQRLFDTAGTHIRTLPSHFPGEEWGQSSRNLLQCFPNLHLSEPRRHNIAAWPLKGRGIAQQPPSVWTSPRPWPPGPGVSVYPVPDNNGNGNANCQEAARTYSETTKIRNPIRPRRPLQPALRASPERLPALATWVSRRRDEAERTRQSHSARIPDGSCLIDDNGPSETAASLVTNH